MKNFVKILLVTVFFCILPVANLFALSKEATEAIEAMRARLRLSESKQEQPITISSSDNNEYVPGRELSAVLARIRRERFEAEKRQKQVHANLATEKNEEAPVVVKPQTEITEENIIVADDQQASEIITSKEEEQEPISVPAVSSADTTEVPETIEETPAITSTEPEVTNKPSQDEIIIIEAMEADDSEAWAVPINNRNNDSAEKTVTPQKAENKNEYVTGQLLERSIRRIRHSQRRSTPASSELDSALEDYERRLAKKQARNSKEIIANANDEIEELFNNPEKRAAFAESERDSYYSDKNADDSEENRIDDDKFNDYISKYDFKMPENYRIIVE